MKVFWKKVNKLYDSKLFAMTLFSPSYYFLIFIQWLLVTAYTCYDRLLLCLTCGACVSICVCMWQKLVKIWIQYLRPNKIHLYWMINNKIWWAYRVDTIRITTQFLYCITHSCKVHHSWYTCEVLKFYKIKSSVHCMRVYHETAITDNYHHPQEH
jgi:hypothetical protein